MLGGGHVGPQPGLEGEGILGCGIATLRAAGFQLCPGGEAGGAVHGLWWGSFARRGSAGALKRLRPATCLIFSCSTRKNKGENQHGLHLTLRVLAWGLVNLFIT